MSSAGRARSDEVRLAVAGSGAMAAYHVRRFRGFPGLRVVACYDRSGDRAAAFAREHQIHRWYSSIPELLDKEGIHGISVAVADREHLPVARDVFAGDTPLFMEKPLVASMEEAEVLGALASPWPRGTSAPERGLRRTLGDRPANSHLVVCNFSKMNYPAIFGAVHLLRSGLLGEVRALRLSYLQSWLISSVWGEWWRNSRWLWRISSSHGGGGAARDLGSHLFYLLLAACGEARTVTARSWKAADRDKAAGSGFSCDMHDSFRTHLELQGGGSARVDASYASPGHTNNIIIDADCAQGRLLVDLERSKIALRVQRRDGRQREYRFAKRFSTYQEFIRLLDGDSSVAHGVPAPTLEDGIEVQRLISASEAAARDGDAAER